MSNIDLSALTPEELDELRVEVLTEQERRQRLEQTVNTVCDMGKAYVEAGGNVTDLVEALTDGGSDE